MILGIDPGPIDSGIVEYDPQANYVTWASVVPNQVALKDIANYGGEHGIAIEMIASYGMAVGKDVFHTCVWIGRFLQTQRHPDSVMLIPRLDVKLNLCYDSRAKDANIRQALIDRIGPPGTKKSPGPTYQVKSHAWAALAVAVTAVDQLEGKGA